MHRLKFVFSLVKRLIFKLFSFYRYGRVNYVLSKRLELLEQVKKLQHSLKIPGEDMHTCETAGYFFLGIKERWNNFLSKVKRHNKKVRFTQMFHGKTVPSKYDLKSKYFT